MSQRKPYNPNTKYGRKKLREQYWEKYNNAEPSERKQMDDVGNGAWLIVLIIIIILTIIIYSTSGENGIRSWTKWLNH